MIIQVDEGRTAAGDTGWSPSSSCSKPSIVADMLDALDVCPVHSVLEIGTRQPKPCGTGQATPTLIVDLDRQRREHDLVIKTPGLHSAPTRLLRQPSEKFSHPLDPSHLTAL